MSFGSDTPGGSVEGIGGREDGIGGGFGGGDNYSGVDSALNDFFSGLDSLSLGGRGFAREQERNFQQIVDPKMTTAYGGWANAAVNAGDYLIGKLAGFAIPGAGLVLAGLQQAGVIGSPAGYLRDEIVSSEIQKALGLPGEYNNVVDVLNAASRAGKSESDIANAYDTVSKRRGGVMGLWEDITGKSAAKAATGAAGTAASYQQQAIDYLKQMGAIPLSAQQGLAGIYGLPGGVGSQQQTIDQVKASPMYSSMMQSGEDAILRQAGATGGLRSGNVQDALARYSGDVLSNLYQQQLSGLTGLAGMGTYAGDIAGGLGSMGNTLAMGQMGAAQARQQGTSNLLGLAGSVYQGIGGWEGIKDIGSGIASAIGSLF